MWILPSFHRELADWKDLSLRAASWPTHLEEIVSPEPTDLGFCVASGIVAGGVWLDLVGTDHNLV